MLIDKDCNILESAQTGITQDFTTPPPEFLKNVKENEPEIAVLPEENYVAAVIRCARSTILFSMWRVCSIPGSWPNCETQASVAEYAATRIAPARHSGELRADVRCDRIDHPDGFGPDRPEFCQLAGRTDTTTDERGQHRLDRRPARAGAGHVSEGDLAQLGETFNKMTQELRTQRDELVSASDLIDSRRRFIEAVLSSASAGIIGVDASGNVGILNRSAEKLIGHAESETMGHPLSDVLPELDDMMKTAREGTQRLVQGQITINRDGHERNLSVRVSAEQTSQSRDSYIITLDDITELVSAQRTSAWGDVARRIAHEIKNPLTPIQLSAERIRRKFGKVITEDKAIFEQCTDTIVRQVDDIRRMVDEFSRFARMPKPV